MSNNTINDFESALKAGLMIGGSEKIGDNGIPFVVIPGDAKVESVERYAERPLVRRFAIDVLTLDSFIDSVRRFMTDQTVIAYTCPLDGNASGSFRAHLDFHEESSVTTWEDDSSGAPVTRVSHTAGRPSWNDARVTFAPRLDTSFAKWLASDRKQFDQTGFAAFLEERLQDILHPDGARLFELITEFEATAAVSITSAIRTKDGTIQAAYSEEVNGKHKTGVIEFPDTAALFIPIFHREQRERITVRLRFRLRDQRLIFWYEIANREALMRDAFDNLVRRVREDLAPALVIEATT